MTSKMTIIIAGLIGFGLMATFTIGLSLSISQGFAGFYGGLPFAIIVGFVLILALYDLFDSAIRNKQSDNLSTPEDK